VDLKTAGFVSVYQKEQNESLVNIRQGCWGYNEESVALPPAQPSPFLIEGVGNDEVTNRVAGLSCKYVFHDHKDAVTGLSCFEWNNTSVLVSSAYK
jgi:hypothetical protein